MMGYSLPLLGLVFALLTKLYKEKEDPDVLWWIKFFRTIIFVTFVILLIINIFVLINAN